jgi:uncharacterized Ntn-hydrolase superfamily protein
VDLFGTPYFNDFITEIIPNVGAIATQAAYLPGNQVNARNEMISGDNPTQLISWLQVNDIQSNPSIRQYGVVRMVQGTAQSAAFTGTACSDYKGHILGPNYSIQGNILLGKQVLDSMESGFKRAKGDLACKLMAAMRGAKMVGADSRCAPNGSSSLFAFLKVSAPSDTFGLPSFLISLRTHTNAAIEPIDSLQVLFNAARTCTINTTGISKLSSEQDNLSVLPVPSIQGIEIKLQNKSEVFQLRVYNLQGEVVYKSNFQSELKLNTEHWEKGIYFVELSNKDHFYRKKLILN